MQRRDIWGAQAASLLVSATLPKRTLV